MDSNDLLDSGFSEIEDPKNWSELLKKSDLVRFKSWLYHRGIFWDRFQDLDESTQFRFLLSFLGKGRG
ncbi:hypothetical protein AKJ41_01985 [candidate division MSBL1 archaeon SCGC-AAA259O05]|uniref:Uncharacterized protein n=1 Tax=candidate division MSBL1 archaeon SCGC-AAA259O05 TaxID=1698271 RepID=A0A133V4C8_9EURY|nr:hypothetical protein AKJ41_01985 [candidate division MSBL1 archaeon SCGC-AAA259O05]